MRRHILVHILLLFGFGVPSLLPKRLRTTYSFKKLVPPIEIDHDDKTSAVGRPCHTCLFFQPHFEHGQTVPSLGKCILFGDTENHEYAIHCRSNIYQCGPDGFCHQPQKQSSLQ